MEVRVARGDRTSFRLSVLRATAPVAPVLVIQPAMGMKAGYYTPLAEALRQAGNHVVVSELRGHEADGGPRPGRGCDFGYAEMVDDVGAAVAAAREEFPGAPVHLLGHSLGGQVSLLYAALHPGAVDGVVLVGCSTVHWRSWSPAFLALSQGFVAIATMVGHFPGKRVGFAGREARSVIRDWGRLARTGRFALGEDELADLDVPVLSVSLEGDSFAPSRAVDALVAKVPSAEVTREHLAEEGLDHFRWARRPDGVVALIGKWLTDR